MKLTLVFDPVARLWFKYKSYVRDVTSENQRKTAETISYWKGELFTNFITYLLPFCLLAAVTGVYVLVDEEVYVLAAVNILAATGVAFVALKKNINLLFRKATIFVLTYALSLALMIYMGLLGPGLIYLLALSVLAILLLPRKLAYTSIAINLSVCILCYFLNQFGLLQTMTTGDYHPAIWMAIVFNMIFFMPGCYHFDRPDHPSF